MDDEEDVKRIMEVLECSKKEHTQDFEFAEFINCEGSDVEETINNNEEPVNDTDDYLLCDLSNADISTLNTYDPKSSLKPEERLVIDTCSDPDLKNILILNRTKNIQLIQLYKKMKDLLVECQNNITEKNEIVKAYTKINKGQNNTTGGWRLAAPYFKDKQLFCSPPNKDTLRKKSNKELYIYDLSNTLKWSSFECEKLIRAVKVNYNISKQTALRKKIAEISVNDTTKVEEVVEMENQLKKLNTDELTEIPPLNSNEFIDWMRVSDVFLKDKHSAVECKSMWHLYLHPQINKSSWRPAENMKLKELSKKHKYQNWDLIAQELGTNRTSFTVCLNYCANLNDKFKRGEFTYEEDARLLDLVYQYRNGNYIPWYKIVQHFKDRTRSQLHYRYTYYLSQMDRKKGKFSEAEDVLLMILVDKFGKNFKKCREYLPARSMVQCKSRYNSNLQNSIKKGSFTFEEDKIIMKYVEDRGTKTWSDLAYSLKRSRGQVRQRYQTIKQILDIHPDWSLISVPRRRHNITNEDDSFDLIRTIANKYLDQPTIPSLEEIEKVIKKYRGENFAFVDVNEECDEDEALKKREQNTCDLDVDVNINDKLTDFFCNSFKINMLHKTVTPRYLSKAVKDVKTALGILKVDLDIPDDFRENSKLDILDIEILDRLLEESKKDSDTLTFKGACSDIQNLIPPNLNNVVGLRSLLIKFTHYKSEENQEGDDLNNGEKHRHLVNNIRNDITSFLVRLQPDIRNQVEDERTLFCRRFFSLFKWPALMTLEAPSPEMHSMCIQKRGMVSNFPRGDSNEMQVKRTYSKADNANASNLAAKRARIEQPPPQSKVAEPPKSTPLKLTPVTNKSVIEDLLRNKNKKLFCFDKVKCGDETKMIIREVPLEAIKKKGSLNKNVNTTKKCMVPNVMESPAPCSSISQCEPGSSKQGSCMFNTSQGECIITDIDDGESVLSYGANSVVDDEEDLKKLNMFTNEYGEFETEDDEDLKDLQKLEMFFKEENKEPDGEFIEGDILCG